jgi:polyisoprenoid-binding protein YceI
MKHRLVVPALLANGGLTVAAGGRPDPAPWVVDAAHTEVNFKVRHFFTPVRGTFHTFEIDLNYDPDAPEQSSVEVRIDVNSVDTGNERRDNHLRSGDWFEVTSYPAITFRSTSVRRVAADRLLARGTLTIKDKSQEVELPITLLGSMDIPESSREMFGGASRLASFAAGLKLDRRDFGVGVGSWAETAIVGSEVDIEIAVEAQFR